MEYTLQRHLDFVGIGERWGCTYVGPINVIEWIRKEPMTEEELDTIIGHCFRRRFAAMANYKNCKCVHPRLPEPKGWDEIDNPEWGYWVEQRLKYARYLELKFDLRIQYEKFKVAIMRTQHMTKHYCIQVVGGPLINPDPDLKGPIIETRPFIY